MLEEKRARAGAERAALDWRDNLWLTRNQSEAATTSRKTTEKPRRSPLWMFEDDDDAVPIDRETARLVRDPRDGSANRLGEARRPRSSSADSPRRSRRGGSQLEMNSHDTEMRLAGG